MSTSSVARTAILASIISFFASSAYAEAQPPAGACDGSAAEQLPARPATAESGSAFVRRAAGMSDDQREAAIYAELMAGNMPQFLRRLSPVKLSSQLADGSTLEATVCVAPDYLAIGSDSDYFLVPMRLDTALSIAGHYGFVLPTRKIVDAIYAQSQLHLSPQPLPASDEMRSTAYYSRHNELVREQRAALGAPLGELTAGDKKDLVVTNRLWSNLERVAIYGWHLPGGRAIQPLSTVHGGRYADYSHGVRLVSAIATVNGQARSLVELLSSAQSAALFSDEGAIPQLGELIKVLRQHVPEPRGLLALQR